MFRNLFVKRI